MEVHASPYLEAIQSLAGCTPSQKYKELNSIAKRAISDAKSRGDVVHDFTMVVKDVPEPLRPLVMIEIAKMLRQNSVVANALKSEDTKLVDRALRIDWFFSPRNIEIVNIEYFATNLFPFVSLNTRIKLIKRLVASFSASRETLLAESFYTRIADIYGKSQAEALLVACGEQFVWNTIKQHVIVLSVRTVKHLFVKYPELVVNYFKFIISAEKIDINSRYCLTINIYKYSNFMPRLIKNHIASLIELMNMHNSCLGIKLSNKATERFIKSRVDVVIERPSLYSRMMPLKVIAAKITKSQYRSMFARLYPPKIQDFQYNQVEEYIAYYPENERISLLLETYEIVYNASILDNHDAINEKILQMLPVDERTRQARVKIAKQPDWRENRCNIEKIWRCYLPLEETISSIIEEIRITSLSNDRSSLLRQMFFVCRLNDDKDSLIRVLQYFTTRHKNETVDVIFDVLDVIAEKFVMSTFGKDHWSIIDDFMKFLHVKNDIMRRSRTSRDILAFSTYFKLSHDLSIDENIDMLIEINIEGYYDSWSILDKYPEYDRITFERMITILPKKYPKDNDIWLNNGIDVVRYIVGSMCDFNNRNTGKKSSVKMDKMSIKSYPWLYEAVEKIAQTDITVDQWKLNSIVIYLETYEIDLYERWFPSKLSGIGDVKTGEALKFLKEDYNKILRHCDDYFETIMSSVSYVKITRRFVKECQWYQNIPMKFLDLCIERLRNEKMENTLYILAILMNGEEFSRVIEPYVPKNEQNIDTTSYNAKLIYGTISTITPAMNIVVPPVSLNLVLNFCHGEFLNFALVTLTNISRRCNVDKIEKFTKKLTDCRVSVKKHGIRLFCMVATIQDYRDFLLLHWKTEKHRSIRCVIFKRIYDLFVDEASMENWILLRDCMKNLKIDDDDDILDRIGKFNDISNSHISIYLQQLFETLETLRSNGYNDKIMNKRISRLLHKIDASTSKLIDDEFAEKLLKKYFCNVDLTVDVIEAGMNYSLYSYLRADETKIDARLKIFGKLYRDTLTKYWNKPDKNCSTYFPINWMMHKFVNLYIYNAGVDSINVKIMRTVLENFTAVLEPQQDWTSYALLIYGIALQDAKETSTIAEKIVETLPDLVEKLTPVLSIELADIVKKWLVNIVKREELDNVKYEVIEKLCRASTLESCTIAAKLLFRSNDRRYDDRRNKIVEFLQNSGYPVAVSIAYQHVNTWDLLE